VKSLRIPIRLLEQSIFRACQWPGAKVYRDSLAPDSPAKSRPIQQPVVAPGPGSGWLDFALEHGNLKSFFGTAQGPIWEAVSGAVFLAENLHGLCREHGVCWTKKTNSKTLHQKLPLTAPKIVFFFYTTSDWLRAK